MFKVYTVYAIYNFTQSAIVKARRHGSIYSLHDCKSFFLARIPSIFLKNTKSSQKTQLCDASSSSTVSQKQKRAFVFKLFLCNPFARSAGIFYALLSQLSSLLRLQFTPLTVNARHYMFENQAIKLLNPQLSWLTGSLTCSGLHNFSGLHTF